MAGKIVALLDNGHDVGICSDAGYPLINDLYLRSRAAGIKAAEILLKGYESKELGLTVKQLETLQDIHKKLTALPDDTDKFTEWAHKEYKEIVPNYNLKNYGL